MVFDIGHFHQQVPHVIVQQVSSKGGTYRLNFPFVHFGKGNVGGKSGTKVDG